MDKKLFNNVLLMTGTDLTWETLGHIVIRAQETGQKIVCHQSVIVGHYVTLEER